MGVDLFCVVGVTIHFVCLQNRHNFHRFHSNKNFNNYGAFRVDLADYMQFDQILFRDSQNIIGFHELSLAQVSPHNSSSENGSSVHKV